LLGRAFVNWLPFTAVMVCYDLSRGAADELGRAVHVTWPATADQRMFGGAVPTEWLQERFHTPGVVHWYDVAASLTYLSYFFVVPLIMAVMWIRNRGVWRRFTANVVALSFAALATYVVFPEAPPWYASAHGVIGSVERLAGLVWGELGLRTAGDLIEEGQATANAVAAMPSLHFGYAMLVAVFFRRRVSRRVRPLLLAYPPAMAISLIYTGEHYVIDVLAGVVYVLAITGAVSAAPALISRAKTAREARRPARGQPAIDPITT
jgi:membrane-associated phospholipid phosphatase